MQKDLNNNSPHEAIDFIQNSSWKLVITMKNFQFETKEVKHLRKAKVSFILVAALHNSIFMTWYDYILRKLIYFDIFFPFKGQDRMKTITDATSNFF